MERLLGIRQGHRIGSGFAFGFSWFGEQNIEETSAVEDDVKAA